MPPISAALRARDAQQKLTVDFASAYFPELCAARLGRLRNKGKLPNAGSKWQPLYRREDLDKL